MDVTSPGDHSTSRATEVRGNHAAHRTTSTTSSTASTSNTTSATSTVRSTAESDSGALVGRGAAIEHGHGIDTAAFDGALTDADLAFLAGAEIGAAVAAGSHRAATLTLDGDLELALDPNLDVVALPPAPPVPPLRYGHLVWSILVAALLWCFAYIHAFEAACAPHMLGCSAASRSLLDSPLIAVAVASALGAGAIGLAPWTRRRSLRVVVAVSLGALMAGSALLALGQLGQLA